MIVTFVGPSVVDARDVKYGHYVQGDIILSFLGHDELFFFIIIRLELNVILRQQNLGKRKGTENEAERRKQQEQDNDNLK